MWADLGARRCEKRRGEYLGVLVIAKTTAHFLPTPRENAPAAINLGSSGQAPAPPPPPAPLLPTGMSFPRRLRQAMVATRLLLTQLAAEERQGGGRQPGPLCSEVR